MTTRAKIAALKLRRDEAAAALLDASDKDADRQTILTLHAEVLSTRAAYLAALEELCDELMPDCPGCAEAAEILQETQAKSLRLLMERGKTIAKLRAALAEARRYTTEENFDARVTVRIDALLERTKP